MMKAITVGAIVLLLAVLALVPAGRGRADEAPPALGPLTTSFTYCGGAVDSPRTARALALFGAKRIAVEKAAEQLAGAGLRSDRDDRRMEINCLVADAVHGTIIDASAAPNGHRYTVTVQSHITLSDFVRAEIADAGYDRAERHLALQREMEPALSPEIAPGRELARVYRYIRRHHWRMAVIYLDRLMVKYPYWTDLFLAKGTAYRAMGEIVRAQQAFSRACEMGNEAGCGRQTAVVRE